MGNIVAIVGRPNVGKSTLFNRLTGQRHAIVDEISGVTRDRIYGKSHWNGAEFSIVDTGGFAINSEDQFEQAIREQVLIAIEEADILLFLVDVSTGITDYDEAVAEIIRKSGKKAFVVVNKVDTHERIPESSYFYALGVDQLYPVSAINGSGTGDLLDALVEALPNKTDLSEEEEDLPKFAIVGRPNAGKSSIINAFIGVDRNIVTPISGTTRDSIHTRYNKFGHDFLLVDTAGIRKKNKVHENLEFYSVMRAVRAIENSDVCILLVDATRGFEGQDQKIFNLIERNRKGVVVVVNKWDLIEKDTHTTKHFEAEIREKTAPYVDYPIIFTSALTKQRIFKVLEDAVAVYENKKMRISTSQLNDYMLPVIEHNPPPAHKGKYIKIKFITQLPSTTPSFAFFCNLPQYVKDPYKRFLENKIRKKWNLTGVPVNIFLRKK
ncbi:ribosome biogenesis GTPase Der [Alkalitalea saponilacus]|uniref:GTPase Der n=1 Tax=Alkalitalea saponilacus TaxID=889453 RepID=A0A1T5HTS1_9BACT|nr:ribosome biogenesis GTPase Der [Alkalitalea saponilacus]ASB48490.1 ribosome biogenesis GTPase Der [Alkalitalea saponilacus]SKC24095.1 GTP-binding protein [Alkalitalea saponilacus]